MSHLTSPDRTELQVRKIGLETLLRSKRIRRFPAIWFSSFCRCHRCIRVFSHRPDNLSIRFERCSAAKSVSRNKARAENSCHLPRMPHQNTIPITNSTLCTNLQIGGNPDDNLFRSAQYCRAFNLHSVFFVNCRLTRRYPECTLRGLVSFRLWRFSLSYFCHGRLSIVCLKHNLFARKRSTENVESVPSSNVASLAGGTTIMKSFVCRFSCSDSCWWLPSA